MSGRRMGRPRTFSLYLIRDGRGETRRAYRLSRIVGRLGSGVDQISESFFFSSPTSPPSDALGNNLVSAQNWKVKARLSIL